MVGSGGEGGCSDDDGGNIVVVVLVVVVMLMVMVVHFHFSLSLSDTNAVVDTERNIVKSAIPVLLTTVHCISAPSYFLWCSG